VSDAGSNSLLRWLNVLYVFVAAAFVLEYFVDTAWSESALFICAALGIIPLARAMGHATEEVAARVGPGLGAFLNATLGNAAEFIIAIVALKAGSYDLIKASITGSIIGNILFILGLSALLGGLRRESQSFSPVAAESGSALLFISIAAISIPSVLNGLQPSAELDVHRLSVAVSIILLATYAASLLFAFRTHKHVFAGDTAESIMSAEPSAPHGSMRNAVILLVVTAVGISFLAEFLVHTVEHASDKFGFGQTFVGVIIVAIVGNAAEHAAAIGFAIKDKMDLSVGIAIESSKQIALFVGPVLVIIGALWGHPMDLDFTIFETAALGMSVLILALLVLDGKTNWLEGAMLLALYAILAIAFYFSK
jgi:Ca2+:H+ antiporter